MRTPWARNRAPLAAGLQRPRLGGTLARVAQPGDRPTDDPFDAPLLERRLLQHDHPPAAVDRHDVSDLGALTVGEADTRTIRWPLPHDLVDRYYGLSSSMVVDLDVRNE